MDKPRGPRRPNPRRDQPFAAIRTGERKVRPGPVFKLNETRRFTDAYHALLSMPLWGVVALMAVVYLAANLLFGALYMLTASGLGNLHRGSYWDAFFFSVQVFGAIDFGFVFPRTTLTEVVATAESFCSLVYVALATGLVFARAARPTARVMFSDPALITDFEGRRTFMLRIANRRSNQILEAEVLINLAHDVTTKEGLPMRRFEELAPLKARSPLFAFTWTVMHVIDETSPLWGKTAEDLDAEDAEVLVLLAGTDDRLGQRVHARHSYLAADILFDRKFVDVLSVNVHGRRVLDYTRFHETKPLQDKAT